MKQALENATPEDRERVEEMLRDLGDLLAAHARGDDTTEQFREFMEQHGEFFPENPQNVDELIDSLAARAAAAQRMLASMTPEQRAEPRRPLAAGLRLPGLMDRSTGSTACCAGCARVRTGTAPSSSAASRDSGSATARGCCRTSRSSTASPTSLAQAHPGARMDDVDLDALAR